MPSQQETGEGEDVSCRVRVDFDHPPAGSHVSEDVRNEAWSIVQSYQPLSHAEIAASNPVHINRHNLESTDNYHAHFPQSSTLPLIALIARLSNPGASPETAAIDNLPPDTYICDLVIKYNNGFESKFPIRRSF